MADVPRWRSAFDAVEREVSPRLQSLMRSDQFAIAVGLATQVRRTVQQQANRSSRRMLHQLNLPAGTDMARILTELGQLRQQVRQLRDELEATKTAPAAPAVPAARDTNGGGAARGPAARSERPRRAGTARR